MKRIAVLVAAVILSAGQAGAQSRNFDLGKGLETQYSVLREVVSGYVDSIDYNKMFIKGINSMLGTLDPYTVYIPEEDEEDFELMTTGNYGGIGALIKKRPGGGVVITEPYKDSPAVKFGLVPGDTIVAIDGKPVFDETSEQSTGRMKGQPGTTVNFTVVKGRTADTVDVVVKREKIHISSIAYSGMIKDSIGYIKITGFTEKLSTEVRNVFNELKDAGARRLVIDLRDNGGGIMEEAVEIISLFVPRGTLAMSSQGRVSSLNKEYFTKSAPVDTVMPLLVMVNSSSASASEITSGALQDLDRATIAGKRTYGKGLIQSVRPVAFNGQVKVTTGKYYIPSGRCVQAIDYSHRNDDGSVGSIPDSLKHEFLTKNGRKVYDGGGITPDIEVQSPKFSRPAYSLVYNDITGDFATEYYKKHESIVPAADFHLTDAEYEEFVDFAAAKDFDARSAAQTALDHLIEAAQQEDLYDLYKAEIDALAAKVNMDKKAILRVKKGEIKPLLEEEIVTRYYFQEMGVMLSLRVDTQLDEAIEKWLASNGI
ncbi:MAG: S41 family peptidase [Bacteroidales bacterium]|nr:S41 family peptidase [Candidatus Cacconaster merdequi]